MELSGYLRPGKELGAGQAEVCFLLADREPAEQAGRRLAAVEDLIPECRVLLRCSLRRAFARPGELWRQRVSASDLEAKLSRRIRRGASTQTPTQICPKR
eukprot:4478707-Amphidinium_carterae.1